MPIDYRDYPASWPELRQAALTRAHDRCEGSPAYPDCRAANHQPHPVTGSRVVLTVAHRHGAAKTTENLDNLIVMCQRCHLGYDRAHHTAKAAATRRRRKLEAGQMTLEEEV